MHVEVDETGGLRKLGLDPDWRASDRNRARYHRIQYQAISLPAKAVARRHGRGVSGFWAIGLEKRLGLLWQNTPRQFLADIGKAFEDEV